MSPNRRIEAGRNKCLIGQKRERGGVGENFNGIILR
jgi:hypothetical protein